MCSLVGQTLPPFLSCSLLHHCGHVHVYLFCMQVNAIFVNIFGGIIRCDEIAKGIIAAAQESNLSTPIVVRLQGNALHVHVHVHVQYG